MSQSERSALLLKVVEEAMVALGPLHASPQALRFEREADSLRAIVESWREAPPTTAARRAIMKRALHLHSEATKYAGLEATLQAATPRPANGSNTEPDEMDENDRPTIPPPFSMEAFAWDMTAPESEHRPPSEPPPQWQSAATEALPIDVELDDALAGWDARPTSQVALSVAQGRRFSPSSIERAVVRLIEESAAPVISQHEIEDPSAYVLERFRVGDYEGAIDMADIILTEARGNLLVRQCRDRCREALAKVCAQKIGPLDRIPVVVTPAGPNDPLPVDHRTGFLLSLIDGTSSAEAILDACGMPRLDALRLLHELAERGVVAFK